MRKRISVLCVVSSAIMSVLDGLWRPVFWGGGMWVMSFVMEEGVSRFIVCPCVVGSVSLYFARGVVGDLES